MLLVRSFTVLLNCARAFYWNRVLINFFWRFLCIFSRSNSTLAVSASTWAREPGFVLFKVALFSFRILDWRYARAGSHLISTMFSLIFLARREEEKALQQALFHGWAQYGVFEIRHVGSNWNLFYRLIDTEDNKRTNLDRAPSLSEHVHCHYVFQRAPPAQHRTRRLVEGKALFSVYQFLSAAILT